MKITTALIPGLAAAALVALAACSTPAPAPAPVSPAEPSTPAAPSAPADPSGTPLSIPCDDLVQASIVTALSPDLVATTDFTPLLGSHAATIAAQGGTACSWTSADGTQSLVVAVSQPTDLASVTSELAAGGTATTAYGSGDVSGYFNTSNGDAEVVVGKFWISAVSTAFTADTTAQPVILSVQQAVPSE